MIRWSVAFVVVLLAGGTVAAQGEAPPAAARGKPGTGSGTSTGASTSTSTSTSTSAGASTGTSTLSPVPAPTAPAPVSAPTAPAPAGAGEAARQPDGLQQRAELLRQARELRAQREEREVAAVRAERDPSDAIARLSLAVSVDAQFYADSGYDVFNDEDDLATRFGLWAAYDVARLSPRITLAVELAGGGESHESWIWDSQIETQLDVITFTAGAALRFAWLPWLDPQLRISGGASRLSFEWKTRDAGTFDDSALSGLGALGAGLFFHTPAQLFENRYGEFASLSFGLLVEGGYALRTAVEPALEGRTEANAIPLTRASLGELGLSGPYVRSSLVARF